MCATPKQLGLDMYIVVYSSLYQFTIVWVPFSHIYIYVYILYMYIYYMYIYIIIYISLSIFSIRNFTWEAASRRAGWLIWLGHLIAFSLAELNQVAMDRESYRCGLECRSVSERGEPHWILHIFLFTFTPGYPTYLPPTLGCSRFQALLPVLVYRLAKTAPELTTEVTERWQSYRGKIRLKPTVCELENHQTNR